MAQENTKTWYVKLIGSSTICHHEDEALRLYKSWAAYFNDVALEVFNHKTGNSYFIRRKGEYFKKYCE